RPRKRDGRGVPRPGAAPRRAGAVARAGGGDLKRLVRTGRRRRGRHAGRDHVDGRLDRHLPAARTAGRAVTREHRALLRAQARAGTRGAPRQPRRGGLITPAGKREARSVLGPTGPSGLYPAGATTISGFGEILLARS